MTQIATKASACQKETSGKRPWLSFISIDFWVFLSENPELDSASRQHPHRHLPPRSVRELDCSALLSSGRLWRLHQSTERTKGAKPFFCTAHQIGATGLTPSRYRGPDMLMEFGDLHAHCERSFSPNKCFSLTGHTIRYSYVGVQTTVRGLYVGPSIFYTTPNAMNGRSGER